MSDPNTNRAPWTGIATKAGAFVITLLLASLVITARESRVTGGFDDPVTVRVSGVARLIVPTEPPKDPDVDPTRWVVQTRSTLIPLDDSDARGLTPGQTVRATYTEGEGLDGIVRAQSVAPSYAPIADRRLLVVPVQWADRPMSATQLANATRTQSEITAWWGAASGGVEALTVRQTPVVNVTPAVVCDDYGVRDQVLAWVKTSEFANWPTNTALLWPENSGCWYGGLGQMPGSFTWMNSTSAKVWVHELGHNMGLPHANACTWEYPGTPYSVFTPAQPSYLSRCRHMEYGNRYDVMGAGNDLSNGFNVQYMNMIGWLADTQVAPWDGGDRTFRLSIATDTAATTRAVKIPAAKLLGSLDEGDYWLQYRAKGPGRYTDDVAGVILMMKPSLDHLSGLKFDKSGLAGYGTFSWLCPISAKAGEWNANYFLSPGVPFDDRLGRFRITLLSIDSSAATLRVQPGPARQLITASDVTATPVSDETGTPTGAVRVDWNAAGLAENTFAEPAIWTAAVGPGGPSCSVPVFARTCTISRVPRNQPLNVTVSATGPPGTGVTVGPTTEPVPITPPLISADSTVSETTAEIRAKVDDDGGLPITSFTVIRENGPACDASTAACIFTDLPSNHTTNFVVQATNGAGQRSRVVPVTTQRRIPAAPVGFYLTDGSTDTITVDAHPLDIHNVTSIDLSCSGPRRNTSYRQWLLEKTFDYTGTPVVLTRDNTVGPISKCYATATARMDAEWGGWSMTGYYALLKRGRAPVDKPEGGTDGGTVTTVPVDNPITLSVKGTRFERGRYVVRWTARSRDGKTVKVTVPKFGSRKCVYRTRTSCVVVGLRPGKTYSVVFVGKTSTATKKVKFSIKAR